MKYIDSNKLKAEIRKLLIPTIVDRDYDEWEKGRDAGLQDAIDIIDSLQQEQPEVDLEKEIEEQIDMYYNECEKKLNQMSDDDIDIGFLTLNNFARHFYELGLNAGKQ